VTFVSDDPGVYTPYSTVKPLFGQDLALWAPDLDRDRISAYQKYEEIYWSHTDAFKLTQRGDDDQPIYVPNPKKIVDTTSHFFLKGLKVSAEKEGNLQTALDKLFKRELFYPRFHTAKHSGVTRGDFLMHLSADPTKPPGTRIRLNSLDPAVYFPEYDDDDVDRIVAVNLAEQIIDPDNPTQTQMRVLRYQYRIVGGRRRVTSQETIYEVLDWWKGQSRKKIREVKPEKELPARITTIPVYHFKNQAWQGDPFGSSEIRGYERLQGGINQSVSDEELALALEGLGVYATDSGPPVDSQGNEIDWEIAPGRVMELGAGGQFRRVEGVNSVKPFQDHLDFLVNSLYETSATFRSGEIDAQVAESGIALAIKFLPTAAKLEERDSSGVGVLEQLFFDWKAWHFEYENENLGEDEVKITLGEKLPENKTDLLNVYNNLVDRKAIPKSFYREQIGEIYGIVFPDNIDALLQKEAQEAFEEAQKRAELGAVPNAKGNDADGNPVNNSNNKNRPNESGGTEANNKQTSA